MPRVQLDRILDFGPRIEVQFVLYLGQLSQWLRKLSSFSAWGRRLEWAIEQMQSPSDTTSCQHPRYLYFVQQSGANDKGAELMKDALSSMAPTRPANRVHFEQQFSQLAASTL